MDQRTKFGMFTVAAVTLIFCVGIAVMSQMFESENKTNTKAMELGYVQQYDAESGRVIWVKSDGTPAEEGISE